jgi:hypothetical protein
MQTLGKLSTKATDEQQFILQELQLWAEAIAPLDDES